MAEKVPVGSRIQGIKVSITNNNLLEFSTLRIVHTQLPWRVPLKSSQNRCQLFFPKIDQYNFALQIVKYSIS